MIYNDDCLKVLKTMEENSIYAIVTDPPYGLNFMGKKWDYDIPTVAVWRECLRVLKPGGHLLAFGGTRTNHRLACRIEDAGFEIRDMIAWVYGSGFPKSLNIGKEIDSVLGIDREVIGVRDTLIGNGGKGNNFLTENSRNRRVDVTIPASAMAKKWEGFGTALKPALEPITMARKPLDGTIVQNVLTHGVGGINVDGCRVLGEIAYVPGGLHRGSSATIVFSEGTTDLDRGPHNRWPANLIHDGSEKVTAVFPKDSSRFFYCAKASASDRDEGCKEVVSWENVDLKSELLGMRSQIKDISDDIILRLKGYDWNTILSGKTDTDLSQQGLMFTIKIISKLIIELKISNWSQNLSIREHILDVISMIRVSGLNLVDFVESIKKYQKSITEEETVLVLGVVNAVSKTLQKINALGKIGNGHNTVKPTDLMRYLCRLVTPPGGIVLDPFMGSGSTGKAAILEGFQFIGIEKEKQYFDIAEARINHAEKK